MIERKRCREDVCNRSNRKDLDERKTITFSVNSHPSPCYFIETTTYYKIEATKSTTISGSPANTVIQFIASQLRVYLETRHSFTILALRNTILCFKPTGVLSTRQLQSPTRRMGLERARLYSLTIQNVCGRTHAEFNNSFSLNRNRNKVADR